MHTTGRWLLSRGKWIPESMLPALDVMEDVQTPVVASVTCLVHVLEVPALKETVKFESMNCNQTQLVGPSEYKVLTNIVCKSCTNMKTFCLSMYNANTFMNSSYLVCYNY